MKRLVIYLVLVAAGICQAEVPKLFTEKNFTSITLAEAANHYVTIGKEATIKELTELARQNNADSDSFLGNGISVGERIGWVCRIVFISDGMNPVRPPKYGYLSLPEKFMPASQWPLYPIAQSGSTYIVLAENYNSKADSEKPAHYISYCANNGVFRSAPVPVPSKEQALKDTVAFRDSDLWKSIKWEDADGTSFPMGEQLAWAFLQNQARLIPDAAKPATMVAKQQPKSNPVATSPVVATTSPAVVKHGSPVTSGPVLASSPAEDESSSPVVAKTGRMSNVSTFTPKVNAPVFSYR